MSYFKSPLRVQDLFDANATSPADGEALVWDAGTSKWIPAALGGGGQANTASNQGVGGVGLYDAKVGVDLQFRNINAASSKITVALDAGNKEVDINLGTVNLDDLADVVITTPSNGYVLTYDSGSGTWIDAAPTGGGGASALDDLTDVTITTVVSNNVLQYNGSAWVNLSLASAGISAVGHAHATSDITSGTFANARIAASNVTQHVASIDHDATLNFVANEHIDHTAVSISTATGLSGGGTIASTRTISLDINSLTADASPVGSTDYVLSWDASASAHKKVLIDNLPSTPTAILDGDFSANGLMTRTASGTYTSRTVTGTTNEISVSNGDGVSGNPTLSLPSTIDLGGKTSLEIPNSAAPTVDADGEIAVDTTVTDFSHGILKYYSTEELGVIAMPIAQFTSPTNNYVVTYDSTADEFQLKAQSGGGASALNDLSDVVIATPANGDFLIHDGTDWDNKTINDLTEDTTPSSPADYIMTWDASASELKKVLLSNIPGSYTPDKKVYGFYDDFIWGASTTGTAWSNPRWGIDEDTATSGSVRYNNDISTGNGVIKMSHGTGATQEQYWYAARYLSNMRLGEGLITYFTRIYIDQLADATNDYAIYIGMHNCQKFTRNSPTNGIYFEYNRSLSTNWRGCTESSSSVTVASGGSSVAVTADTWIELTCTVNAAASSVEFFVNGTSLGTCTTNIPSNSTSDNFKWLSYATVNSAGTGSGRNLYIDWAGVYQILTTSR